MKRYNAAVNELAFNIVKYADRDLDQFADPVLDNTDLMMEHIDDTPEIQDDWNGLEAAADDMMVQYGVAYEVLLSDVWQALIRSDDPEVKKYWN